MNYRGQSFGYSFTGDVSYFYKICSKKKKLVNAHIIHMYIKQNFILNYIVTYFDLAVLFYKVGIGL